MSKRVNLKAIQFDGTNDYITIPDSVERFSFTNGVDQDQPFSLSAWVYLTEDPVANSNGGAFISKSDFDENVGGQGIGTEWFFRHKNGEVQLFLYDSPPQTGEYLRIRADAATLAANRWILVAATYDGSSLAAGLKLYQFDSANSGEIDATAQKHVNYQRMSKTNSKVFIGAAEEIEDGNAVANRTFEGKLADICIFDKQLSLAEVTEIYNEGKVKDMTKFSAYNNVVSWWKMGDDRDFINTKGILDYKSGFHGTPTSIEKFETVPALDTDRIFQTGFRYTSYGRSRQPKNIANDHAVYIHGGISGDVPKVDPNNNTPGFVTENQRFLHMYWKAEQTNKTHEITAFGYSHSAGTWSLLYDTSGNQIKLNTANAAVDIYRVFEISGVDKVYFKSTGADDLLGTDLLAAAASTF